MRARYSKKNNKKVAKDNAPQHPAGSTPQIIANQDDKPSEGMPEEFRYPAEARDSHPSGRFHFLKNGHVVTKIPWKNTGAIQGTIKTAKRFKRPANQPKAGRPLMPEYSIDIDLSSAIPKDGKSNAYVAKERQFYCYRYYVVPNGSGDVTDRCDLEKDEIVKKFIHFVSDENKSGEPCSHFGDENYQYYLVPFTESAVEQPAFVLWAASISNIGHVPNIISQTIVLVDTETQVVRIEKAMDSPSEKDPLREAFTGMVESFMESNEALDSFHFSLGSITEVQDFWDTVYGSDQLFELTLSLKSPNMLWNNEDMNEFLSDLTDALDNENTNITIKNSNGNLKISNREKEKKNTVANFISNAVQYISQGGGFWSIVRREKAASTMEKIRSEDKTRVENKTV